MEKQILCRVICRCLKDDILDICGRWNFLPENSLSQINIKKPKIRIAEEIYNLSQDEGLNVNSAGELDLIYNQLHASARKWSTFELRGQDQDHFISNPTLFRRTLLAKLKLYFDKVYVNVNLFSGALWGRVHIIDRRYPSQYKPNDVIYLVHYPKTPFIFVSRVKAKDEETFKEALLPVFKTDSIAELNLIGRHVSSLVELALNKNSQENAYKSPKEDVYSIDLKPLQGSFGKYRSIEERENPYVRRTRKRKASPEPAKEVDKRLRGEDEAEKKQRTKLLDNAFGTVEQPKLEKLEYKMHVKFRGTKHAPAMVNIDKPFRCRIKFEGTSVLEGIRNLGKAGLASVPMPSHLTKVNSLAKNFFYIRDKTASDKSKE